MEGFSIFSLISSLILYSTVEWSLAANTISPARSIHDGETLVSSDDRFELGFFSPGKSKSRYLGLWYKESPGKVVWIANRNNPILDTHGVLRISSYGNLVLLNQKGIVWSVNMSRKVVNPVAKLLNSGNLVVWGSLSINNSERYVWQSFDYPSDTLLPGMKLGWDLKSGLERYLTSWRGDDDPSSGDFTLRLDIHILPQLSLYKGSMKMMRTGPWNGVDFGGIPTNPNLLFKTVVVHNEDEIYYRYEFFNNPIIMLLKLNKTGKVQRQIWEDKSRGWNIMYSEPIDLCGIYGRCGANGVCSVDKTPTCGCVKGFRPHLPYNQTSPNTCISLKQCKAACLKNCGCRAYANSNLSEGGRGCLMWSGNLIDIRKHLGDMRGQNIYIRVPAPEPGL